jgi:hypothetical protein
MTDPTQLLPPLPHAVLESVLRIRDSALRALNHCKYPGTDTLNVDRALEILCGYAVEETKLRLDFYESLPEFSEKRARRVGLKAAESILACFPQYEFVIPGASQMIDAGGGRILQYEDPRQFMTQVGHAVLTYVDQRLAADGKIKIAPQPTSRKKLRDEYFAYFPDERIIIRDVCWAVKQRYREWKRWKDGELPDGSTADLAFRRILTSKQRPREFNLKPRPKGWE